MSDRRPTLTLLEAPELEDLAASASLEKQFYNLSVAALAKGQEALLERLFIRTALALGPETDPIVQIINRKIKYPAVVARDRVLLLKFVKAMESYEDCVVPEEDRILYVVAHFLLENRVSEQKILEASSSISIPEDAAGDIGEIIESISSHPVGLGEYYHSLLVKSYQDQNTSIDLEAWMRLHYPSVYCELRNAHIDLLKPTVEQMVKLFDLYPDVTAALPSVKIRGFRALEDEDSSELNKIYGCYMGYGGIELNDRAFSDPEIILSYLKKAYEGNFLSSPEIGHIFAHEFAHALCSLRIGRTTLTANEDDWFKLRNEANKRGINVNELMIEKGRNPDRPLPALTPVIKDGVGTVKWAINEWAKNVSDLPPVSLYGETNILEQFTEAFGQMHTQDRSLWADYTIALENFLQILGDPAEWFPPGTYQDLTEDSSLPETVKEELYERHLAPLKESLQMTTFEKRPELPKELIPENSLEDLKLAALNDPEASLDKNLASNPGQLEL